MVVETRQLAVSGTSHSEKNIDDIGLKIKIFHALYKINVHKNGTKNNFLVRQAVNVVKNARQIHISSSCLEKPIELARQQRFVEIVVRTTEQYKQ